jgi:hypothetical protein
MLAPTLLHCYLALPVSQAMLMACCFSPIPPPPAGIQSMKLEDLERRLRADMLAEAGAWGGRVLLHREVAAPRRAPTPSPLRPARGGDEEGVEDITRAAEDQPLTMQVQAFWESSGDVGDIDQVGSRQELAVPASACAYTARQRRHLKRGALAEPPPFPFRSSKPRQLPLPSPSSSSGLCCIAGTVHPARGVCGHRRRGLPGQLPAGAHVSGAHPPGRGPGPPAGADGQPPGGQGGGWAGHQRGGAGFGGW